MKRFLLLAMTAGLLSPVSAAPLSDIQIYHMATYRCLAQEGILNRNQITQLAQQDAKDDPNWASPILKRFSTGLTKKELNKQERIIKENGGMNALFYGYNFLIASFCSCFYFFSIINRTSILIY
tara:strand:- start:31 stop:402 length:372 start_codon:yes stop_codon:yes gene_type:complete